MACLLQGQDQRLGVLHEPPPCGRQVGAGAVANEQLGA